ncbi:MAG: FkbM family methyltransferase [Promethearchaeota archaeon]
MLKVKSLNILKKKIFLGPFSNYIDIIYEGVLNIFEILKIRLWVGKFLNILNLRMVRDIRIDLKNKKFFLQFIKRGDLCFDVGANIGKISNILLNIGAKVICIEPQKSCLKSLNILFRNNENVIIVNKALGAKEGNGEIYICDDANAMSTLSEDFINKSRYSEDYNWRKKSKVAITTLDKLIQIYGLPKYCKVDVEGYELEVFQGLSKKIPIISFEFHMEFINIANECLKLLSILGDIEVNFAKSDVKELILDKWVSPQDLTKFLKSIKDEFLWGDIYVKFI